MDNDFVPRNECDLVCQRLKAEDDHQNERIDKLEKQQSLITELTISVKELALEVKNVVREIASQNARIQTLENRDGIKWRDAVKTVITVIITAVVTAAIAFFR